MKNKKKRKEKTIQVKAQIRNKQRALTQTSSYSTPQKVMTEFMGWAD
ncbi:MULTISPECIES: hypothetical protein [unclassified Paenibacillus]|nr:MULTISPECIES: hypothetical protein [unclassified Paenibacillus]